MTENTNEHTDVPKNVLKKRRKAALNTNASQSVVLMNERSYKIFKTKLKYAKHTLAAAKGLLNFNIIVSEEIPNDRVRFMTKEAYLVKNIEDKKQQRRQRE